MPVAYKNYGFTDTAVTVLKERYLLKNPDTGEQETIPDMFRRVAYCVAKGDVEKANKYYDMMMRRDFLPNSPTLMNAGKEGKDGQLSACYVLPVEDSMEGIFDALKNMALIHKSGGGTGFNFSPLRPEGARVGTTNGLASGPVSFMKLFDEATECVMQGGARRGANMGILNVDHPDILKFIKAKGNGELTNFNLSVGMTDEFMEAISENTATDEQYAVWDAIVQNAWKSGDPGLVFLDEINWHNHAPQLGHITATNPCLRENMKILTDKGYIPISDLAGKNVKVWNGFEWSEVEPHATGHNQKMLRITFSNGSVLDCTPYHKFILYNGVRLEAKSLKEGDILQPHTFPVICTKNIDPQSLTYMYCAGFFVGDGTCQNSERERVNICLYDEKKKLLNHFIPFATSYRKDTTSQQRTIVSMNLEYCWDKEFVPSAAYSVEERLAWLAGFIDADGTRNSKDGSIAISNINYDILVRTKELLNTLGINSTLALSHAAGEKLMSNGSGDLALYHCQECYRLVISAWNSKQLQRLGLRTYRVNLNCNPNRNAGRKIRVVSVVPCEDAETVYCLTEPKRHSFVAEGVITGNCGEAPLHAFEACNLGSINLSNFVVNDPPDPKAAKKPKEFIAWGSLERTVELAVEFLNDVIDVNHYPLPEIDRRVKELRSIGLGVMGWADMLNKLGIRYGSEASLELADIVMSNIQEMAHLFSRRRNAAVTCIAPTGTISLIAGCSSGIEPLFALKYDRVAFGKDKDADGNSKRQVLHMIDSNYMTALKNNDYRLFNGTFVTTKDIPWIEHIEMLAAFQYHTDLAVSKTINLPRDATLQDIEDAYLYAWAKRCKGITVFRDGCLGTQVLYTDKDSESVPTAEASEVCPECGEAKVIREGGCKRCTSCGWSPCAI